MDNGMENMLDMYLFETNTLIEQLDGILLAAEKDVNFSQEHINEIFRIMHTIKGSSAMMQFSPIAEVAHHIEDLFYSIRQHGVDASYKDALFDLMFRSNDFLKEQVEHIQNGEPLSDNIDSFIKDITVFLNNIQNGQNAETAAPAAKEAPAAAAAQPSMNTIRVFFDEGCGMEHLRAFMLVNTIKEACEDFTFTPANVETDPSTAESIIENGFLLHFNSDADVNSALVALKTAVNVQTYELLEGAPAPAPAAEAAQAEQPAAKTEEKKPEAKKEIAPPPATQQVAPQAASKQSLISVNLTKLDKLMDIVGEIVIAEAMVNSNPELKGLKLDNFNKATRQLRKLTDELQDIVMSIRLVPVAGVFQKMNRIVRDIGQQLGKDVKLTIIGEDTEVDKTIVDSISDPIMHMVRNSMDHGIEETAAERTRLGKPSQGELVLAAEHTGSEVIISISDDGKGIDTERVLNKARDNGLLTKPESEYSKKEIYDLLLLPGFSTKSEATEYSGRGVGMDVVKKNIEKVGGTVVMTSEPGQGTRTVFKIPLTLAILDGMDISVGESLFTIPIINIRQSFKATRDEIVFDSDHKEMIRRMDNFYPVIRLHDLYQMPGDGVEIEDGILIWIETGDNSYCLFVDELLGEQQVVVKPIPAYLNDYNVKELGIAGCAILGDGTISMIMDVNNLFELFRGR